MITLHAIEGATGRSGLEDAVLSCGIIDPLDHEELFEAVVDEALFEEMLSP